jgi:hypothetical protein
MRHILPSIVVVVFSGPLACAAEPTGAAPESKVLARWLGTWECRAVFKRAQWNPEERRITETKTCKWILGGKFLEETGRSQEPKREYRAISGYDAQRAVFRSWLFDSEGNTSEWIGTWDGETTTMTWTSDLDIGVDARMLSRFVGPDNYEITVIVKDKTGKTLMHVQAEHVRVKE